MFAITGSKLINNYNLSNSNKTKKKTTLLPNT